MKAILLTTMITLIAVITLSAQKKYSKEEKALIGVIQEHYDHWKNRDYEKWTALWVHDNYVEHSYTLPDHFIEDIGWDEVSTSQKNFIKNNPYPAADVDFGQFDYTFLVGDNMAIVKFTGEGGIRTTSAFKKVKGTWKYVLNEQVDKPMFELKSDLEKLKSFKGDWQLVPDSFKWENSKDKGEIIGYEMKISPTLNGIDIHTKYNFRNAQHTIWRGTENFSIHKNSPSKTLIHTMSTHYINNGWTENGSGTSEIKDQTIELNGAKIGNEKNTYRLVIKKESGDQINVSGTDSSGEEWSVDMKLIE